MRCERPGWSAGAGTFRADAQGRAYVVLTTAARIGEYERIRIVRGDENVLTGRSSTDRSRQRATHVDRPGPRRGPLRRLRRRRRRAGDGGDAGAPRPSRRPPTTAAPPRPAAASLDVAAPESGALEFDPKELTAKAGEVTFNFSNPSGVAARVRHRGRRRRRGRDGARAATPRRSPSTSSPATTSSTARSAATARRAWWGRSPSSERAGDRRSPGSRRSPRGRAPPAGARPRRAASTAARSGRCRA